MEEAYAVLADEKSRQRDHDKSFKRLAMSAAEREGLEIADAMPDDPRAFVVCDGENNEYAYVTVDQGSLPEPYGDQPGTEEPALAAAQSWVDEHPDKFGITEGMRIDRMTFTMTDDGQITLCVEGNAARVRTPAPLDDAASLLAALDKYKEAQISGRGGAACPMGSFEAARDRIEELADAVGGFDAHRVKNELEALE